MHSQIDSFIMFPYTNTLILMSAYQPRCMHIPSTVSSHPLPQLTASYRTIKEDESYNVMNVCPGPDPPFLDVPLLQLHMAFTPCLPQNLNIHLTMHLNNFTATPFTATPFTCGTWWLGSLFGLVCCTVAATTVAPGSSAASFC